MASSVYALFSGDNASYKKQSSPIKDVKRPSRKSRHCTITPILAFADFSKPFKLHMDPSTKWLDAVLYQEQNSIERIIRYASRSLSKDEVNYPTSWCSSHSSGLLLIPSLSTCLGTPLWYTQVTIPYHMSYHQQNWMH